MKNISVYLIAFTVLLYVGCDKDEELTVYSGGTSPELTSNVSTVEMTAADSNSTVLVISWTNPNYTVDGEVTTHNVNYTVEIDQASNNFQSARDFLVTNDLQLSFTGKELNRLMSNLDLEDTTQVYSMAARVTASLYVSSSELTSSVLSLAVRPYSTKPVALYPVPDNLFLVGDATTGGWANPVPVPSQKFTKLDEFTFGGAFQLNGGLKYLFLPVNGDWGHKYAVADASAPGATEAGSFTVDEGQDIPAPANSGLYKIIVDFVKGTYEVTELTSPADTPPSELYIVGNATPGGWDNPVPVPTQQFTQVSNGGFEITIDLNPGAYLFLPENGSWDHKYAIPDASVPEASESGMLVVDSGQDIPSPSESGTYTIFTEFITRTYTVTPLE